MHFFEFTVSTMSNDRKVLELLRDFRERGLQNLMSNPPCEEASPAPKQPMQIRSTRKKFKVELHSKWNEERYNPLGKTQEDHEMYPPGPAEWRHVVCLMQNYSGMQSQGHHLLRTQSCDGQTFDRT